MEQDKHQADQFNIASKHARECFLYGCSARAANHLMRCGSLDFAIETAQSFLEEMGLSGYFFITLDRPVPAVRFGENIKRETLLEVKEFLRVRKGQTRVCVEERFIYIFTPIIELVVVRVPSMERDVDVIQDILPIYFDSFTVWLEDYVAKQKLRNSLSDILEGSVDIGQTLIGDYLKISDELVCDMVSHFPTLGLEADQENLILDIVNGATESQITVIEHEIQIVSKVGDMLISAIHKLDEFSENRDQGKDVNGSDSVELF